MWRSLFLAVGIMLAILGAECLLIDSATLYGSGGKAASANASGGPATRVWTPAEWMPWTLLSSGAIVVLYAFTLPKRWGSAA